MNVITVADAAARLGLSAARVRALIGAGDLPARKLGGRWVLDLWDAGDDRPRRAAAKLFTDAVTNQHTAEAT